MFGFSGGQPAATGAHCEIFCQPRQEVNLRIRPYGIRLALVGVAVHGWKMSILTLILILCFIGFVLWFINAKGDKLNSTIKLLINIVLVIVAVVLCLSALGVWDQLKNAQVPKL